MIQTETKASERTVERASSRIPGQVYWLISKIENHRVEVLTLDRDGEEVLPVFGHEEEAALFLWLGDVDDSWQVRESRAGELVSLLYGPCANVGEVALDPLPEMVHEKTVKLVSLSRERFVERVTAFGRPLELHEPVAARW